MTEARAEQEGPADLAEPSTPSSPSHKVVIDSRAVDDMDLDTLVAV